MIGNPADPAIMNTGFFSAGYPFFKFTSAYIYDYTPDKKYEAPDQMIKRLGLHSQLANVSLIFVERLQLYGSFGGSKEILQEQPIYEMIFDTHTHYHFSYSLGGKVILFQWGQTYLGLDFNAFEIPSSHKSFFQYLNRLNLPLNTDEKQTLSLNEWQGSLGLASRFFFLTPYVGGIYLHSRLHADKTYHNQYPWGYFYGVTLSLTGRLHANFERRLRDESAYTFSGIMVF
ncbi:MAG: hypothetical protein ACD_17C00376G0002 [uncultured bacterium]|nr:MAG: hypothetical protein ACD_17C00376G0002 [uncultured bacterium]OGN58109.1 MAG: hypothetical protein A3C42_03695 [Chlamydiae bacterium RIFCSPHIGHO2_02_FULL_45_9]OGN69807.1 MAG: hypothetical protein A3I67_06885 [Chlamydiae bacterium RIFCSPLOWO2_02_FULL_45_22]